MNYTWVTRGQSTFMRGDLSSLKQKVQKNSSKISNIHALPETNRLGNSMSH